MLANIFCCHFISKGCEDLLAVFLFKLKQQQETSVDMCGLVCIWFSVTGWSNENNITLALTMLFFTQIE